MVQSTVSIRLVAVPGIVVKGVGEAVGNGFVHAGEDDLTADYAPCCSAGRGFREFVVEPGFLRGAHEGTAGVVGDGVDVVGVPVEIGYGAVVVAGVEHDEIH